jgi:release factor glutamine methyltransferase
VTIAQALQAARAAGLDRLDAMWLLEHLLGRPRSWLLAHDDEPLPGAAATRWPSLLARRAAGEPLAYVVGEREFCGLRLAVSSAVLVPRPETELLVRWALERLLEAPAPRVVDLGTGSGAIALAIAHAAPQAQVWATDTSAAALEVAERNARRLALPLRLARGDWWQAVPGQRFGLAVSNPPYIAAGDPHLAGLGHEPMLALSPGGDGLDAIRTLVASAPAHLLPGAWLLLEHGHDQADAVCELLTGHGFEHAQTRPDLAGLPRCTGARWPAVPAPATAPTAR